MTDRDSTVINDRSPADTGPPEPTAKDSAAEQSQERGRRRRRLRQRLGNSRIAYRLLAFAGFAATWWIAATVNEQLGWMNPVLLPSPLDVARAGVDLARQGLLLEDITASLYRATVGFGLAAVAGVALGTVTGHFRILNNVFEPLVELLRPIPPLAFLPMFVIWFGIGETSKILFITYSSFFPIFLNTYAGVRYVDPLLIRASRSLGVRKRQLLLHVVVPDAVPYILTGLRLGMGMALFVLVAAELIVAQTGIGYRIQWARQVFRVDVMLFGAFLIGILGFLLNAVLRWSEQKLLRWKD